MFAALHGAFVRHPWLANDAEGPILDHLLRDRTQSLFWSMGVGAGVAPGTADVEGVPPLWDVYDAGPDRLGPAEPDTPIAWFHVVDRTPTAAPLPIRPFLVACGDALERLGHLDLTSVQALLPVDRLDPSQRTALYPQVDGLGWWAACDPADEVGVTICLDSGRDPSAADAAPAILSRLLGLDQWVVSPPVTSARESQSSALTFVLSDHLWPGPAGPGSSSGATLAEWNLDTIGWLAAVIADIAADEGVRTPLLLTVLRGRGASTTGRRGPRTRRR